jgi:hypothetical protein
MTPRHCNALNRHGAPCNAYAIAGSDYCFHHDPDRTLERNQARRKGGRARHGRHLGPVGPHTSPNLDNLSDVAALLRATINDTLQLENSLHRARTIGYLSGLLLKALDLATLDERLTQVERALKLRENTL